MAKYEGRNNYSGNAGDRPVLSSDQLEAVGRVTVPFDWEYANPLGLRFQRSKCSNYSKRIYVHNRPRGSPKDVF